MELQKSNIFSVKTTNGQKIFTIGSADFAIVDRVEYGLAFAGKIRILDYSIEEVRACRPLLLALGLRRQHLSELVEETTMVQGGVLSNRLSQDFQSKAYALFRYVGIPKWVITMCFSLLDLIGALLIITV